MAKHPQAPSAVVMIRPHHFRSNPQTQGDNHFQRRFSEMSDQQLEELAMEQVTNAAATLEAAGVGVHLFEDTGDATPDSVFPNNWFSTHAGGHVAVYPMYAENRRKERRYDIIDMLKREYRVQDVVDYSGLEHDDLHLEGTGAMVLDHIERVAYVARSNRADPLILERFCTQFNYEPMLFDAFDQRGNQVYHTNVLMCIGTQFAMAGFELMPDQQRRNEIIKRLQDSGREVINLSAQQIESFCGNALELSTDDELLLALSQQAFEALNPQQKEIIQRSHKLLPLDVSAIELAGGSVRCMLAGIHLSKR